MSELLRGTITVMILVSAISVIYLVIQNYKDKNFPKRLQNRMKRMHKINRAINKTSS